MTFRSLVSILSIALPWRLRRLVLVHGLGYSIDETARIGCSLIFPKHLEMGPGSRIGHLNLCQGGIEKLFLGDRATIGNLNWITGEALGGASRHFKHIEDRRPELILGAHAAVTNRHYIDCTAAVSLGPFSTFAGCRSQIMTHSIDLDASRQSASPVCIGAYCFVGTDCVLLGGASLPDRSVLGAKSLLNKPQTETRSLYAGVPARLVKHISADAKYFARAVGFVD